MYTLFISGDYSWQLGLRPYVHFARVLRQGHIEDKRWQPLPAYLS